MYTNALSRIKVLKRLGLASVSMTIDNISSLTASEKINQPLTENIPDSMKNPITFKKPEIVRHLIKELKSRKWLKK